MLKQNVKNYEYLLVKIIEVVISQKWIEKLLLLINIKLIIAWFGLNFLISEKMCLFKESNNIEGLRHLSNSKRKPINQQKKTIVVFYSDLDSSLLDLCFFKPKRTNGKAISHNKDKLNFNHASSSVSKILSRRKINEKREIKKAKIMLKSKLHSLSTELEEKEYEIITLKTENMIKQNSHIDIFPFKNYQFNLRKCLFY
ncbi:hypothetical protein BpHYR1_022558 [Brachionus plicatilis]|uniref:Uncharacterized protein n=1 Tax=Brachionus plicatilis TaxID=10195 RepID=A0A3M7PYA7_BRAPC|nr:hypothetical protein BpHYR1_022558 [Brachionus plicatilis]